MFDEKCGEILSGSEQTYIQGSFKLYKPKYFMPFRFHFYNLNNIFTYIWIYEEFKRSSKDTIRNGAKDNFEK